MELPVDSYVPKNRLATSKDKARAFLGRHARGGRSFLAAQLAAQNAAELMPQLSSGGGSGETVAAEVNHGRWIAHCECGGAEVVDPDDPIFLCLSCLNQENGRALRPVKFPSQKMRLQIQEVLCKRPDRRTRGWGLEESIEDLRRQNLEHGDRT